MHLLLKKYPVTLSFLGVGVFLLMFFSGVVDNGEQFIVGDKPPVANILSVSDYTNILTLHTVLTLKLPRQVMKYKRECTNEYTVYINVNISYRSMGNHKLMACLFIV